MIFDVVQSMNKCSSVSSSAPHKIHSISPICFLLYSSKGDKVEPLSSEPNPEPRDSWCPSLMDLRINPWARTWPKRCFCPKPHVCANSKEENVNALIRFFLIYQSPKRCKPEKKKKKNHGTTDNGKCHCLCTVSIWPFPVAWHGIYIR